MSKDSQNYQSLDGMEYVYKRANSRTPREASFRHKLTKRRKKAKAARRRKRGSK